MPPGSPYARSSTETKPRPKTVRAVVASRDATTARTVLGLGFVSVLDLAYGDPGGIAASLLGRGDQVATAVDAGAV